MTDKNTFDTDKEVSETTRLTNSIDSLTEMVERLCSILEVQADQKPKKPRVEWHDTFHDETPLSLMRGWDAFPAIHRNALEYSNITTFGDLRELTDFYNVINFGKVGYRRLKHLVEENGVVTEYFPALT